MFDNEEKNELRGGAEETAQAPAKAGPVYEYGQESAGKEEVFSEAAGENVPPYHPGTTQSGQGAPQAPIHNEAQSQNSMPPQGTSPTAPGQPVEYIPPMNGAPPAGGMPPSSDIPPKQTQWTFNDYGPLGGPGKEKKQKKVKAGKSADGNGLPPEKKSGAGVKVLAIVMSVLFVLSVAGFGSYIVYGMNRAKSPDRGGPSGSKPSFEIQEPPQTGGGDSSSAPAITGNKMEPSAIYDAVEPAVVGVVGYVKGRNGIYQVASQGSGVVFDSNGYIVTNRHVIKDELTELDFEKIEVIRTTGESYTAQVLGSDKETDLAVLKVEDNSLKTAVFGDSDLIKVGDKAFVIGNPSGLEYAGSLAGGYISAINREVFMDSINTKVELIQTDAAINPGNSGGALVNEYGQVVGITSAKLVGEEYEGMGFAIPINNVKPIVESLINNGYVAGRVQIGLTYKAVSKTLADLNGIPQGLRVVSINDDSDAKKKDVQVGDIIYAMDGVAVTGTTDVKKALENKNPGDTITLSIYRVDLNGRAERLEVEVKLQEKIVKES